MNIFKIYKSKDIWFYNHKTDLLIRFNNYLNYSINEAEYFINTEYYRNYITEYLVTDLKFQYEKEANRHSYKFKAVDIENNKYVINMIPLRDENDNVWYTVDKSYDNEIKPFSWMSYDEFCNQYEEKEPAIKEVNKLTFIVRGLIDRIRNLENKQ